MAGHNQRWCPLFCTKLHISSTSAASTRRISTGIVSSRHPATTALFTCESPLAFFYLLDPRARPPPQDAPAAPRPKSPSETLRAIEEAQRKEVTALKGMVELMIEKGVFTREEYLAKVKR